MTWRTHIERWLDEHPRGWDHPIMLDLFSGAGGCAMGYSRAGFAVFGVDLNADRLRHYPFESICADALEVAAAYGSRFDAIHASPPCQAYSITKHSHDTAHPELLEPTRELLRDSGALWVIENVPGAPMPDAMPLCGSALNLTTTDVDGSRVYLRRHRLFESNVPLLAPGPCQCRDFRHRGWKCAGVYGGGTTDRNRKPSTVRGGYTPGAVVQRALMGIEWMPREHLNQAIPPIYTQVIGEQLVDHAARFLTPHALG